MRWRSTMPKACSNSVSCARVAVVALGNPYRTDDGVGPAVLRLLEETRHASRVTRLNSSRGSTMGCGWRRRSWATRKC